MKRITVLVAEESKFIRQAVRMLLELQADLEVVGEARNGRAAVAKVKKLRPAVVVMDVAMPRVNGLEATRQILEAAPATKVLMFSTHIDDVYVEEAINSGARGYLIKQTSAGSLCDAIRALQKGKTYFSPSIPSHLHKRKRKSTPSTEA